MGMGVKHGCEYSDTTITYVVSGGCAHQLVESVDELWAEPSAQLVQDAQPNLGLVPVPIGLRREDNLWYQGGL